MIKNAMRQRLVEIVTKIQAIEVIGYYDKNLLANDVYVSQQKQEMVSDALEILEKYQLDTEPDLDGKMNFGI